LPVRQPAHTASSRGPRRRWRRIAAVLACVLFLVTGCAKYNTYYNAKRAFDSAEHERDEAIKQHKDPPKPTGQQKTNYETAARKAQKILDEYPGHSLTDDALFLQGKAYYRLESYRMSIRKFELLFQNFPATPYLEEALYLQALNYLLIGAVDRSQDFLDLLANQFPDSDYQAETLKVSGDNAYTLEKWRAAADSYQEYLDRFPGDFDRDRIGLKLAECYWELREYDPAATVLQEVSNSTSSNEMAFRARLLRARVHVRIGDYEVSDLLLDELEKEAEIYRSQGEVQLTRAEGLVAQDKGEQASPLLENMPAEWETPEVKARAAEILGNLYLERGELEEARKKFQDALRRKDALEDLNRCRILNQTLSDYLAAEQALPDAKADRVPRLKLLQANSMLFGFERPGEAARLYVEIYAGQLTERYPDSPQAYEVRTGQEGDLLGFLLARQASQQQERYADLSPEELIELNTITGLEESVGTGRSRGLEGVRRRLVYLARRDNILVNPSPELIQAATSRQPDRPAGRRCCRLDTHPAG
jgi:TolA-binding protein